MLYLTKSHRIFTYFKIHKHLLGTAQKVKSGLLMAIHTLKDELKYAITMHGEPCVMTSGTLRIQMSSAVS